LNKHFNLRSIFVDAIKRQEGVGFSKEIFFIQLCGTKVQRYFILKQKEHNFIQNIAQNYWNGNPAMALSESMELNHW